MKVGRFFSAIGYLNEKHSHVWEFGDAPLIYHGLFGDQLTEDGVQVTWLLPTDTYFLVGGEAVLGTQQFVSPESLVPQNPFQVYLQVSG